MRVVRSLLLLAFLVSGCKSATVHLYTLASAAATPQGSISASTPHEPFVIGEVSIPTAVDRKELVVRDSAHGLLLLENEHWATSLRDEVRHGFARELQRALTQPPSGAPQSATSIDLHIRDWEAGRNAVYFKVQWRLRRGKSSEALEIQCESEFTERTTGTPEDLVRADQALLAELAKPIARALQAIPPASCEQFAAGP